MIPDDPKLLDEVTNLVEQPTALLGHFEEEYLKLPDAVLVAVMKKHQRYFPVVDGDGNLMPHFVVIRNGGEAHLDSVRHGNEEVIRARFADADFFYREDLKKTLEEHLLLLGTLTFQEQLGSMLDKTYRLEKLVPQLARMLGLSAEETQVAKRAAHLCKADLVTHMVVEMTSLQGIMGREYALKSGEDPNVAEAVFQHYLQYLAPSARDVPIKSRPGLIVGLANRLDSLAGLFAVGLAPTGSSDPYGLRRDALGVVQNLLAHELPFSVRAGLEAAAALMPVDVSQESLAAALEFVVERLRGTLRDEGFAYDAVDAVLAARGDDPFRARQAVEQLAAWVARDDWSRTLENYARCVRITRDLGEQYELDSARFVQPAEEALYAAYQEARAQVTSQSSVDQFLTAFVPLVDVIDAYFARESGVMVMDEDADLRQNRLAQLQHIAALAEGIVDLSRLEGF
jgi:glycyl-tRNA synthetase